MQAVANSSLFTLNFRTHPQRHLSFDELLDEAMDGKSVEPSIAKACVTEFMKAVKRNVLKGFRCQLGDNFLTVYPNIQLSVKDYIESLPYKLGDKVSCSRCDVCWIVSIVPEKYRNSFTGNIEVRVNPAKKDGTRSNREFVLYYGEIDSIKKIN